MNTFILFTVPVNNYVCFFKDLRTITGGKKILHILRKKNRQLQ